MVTQVLLNCFKKERDRTKTRFTVKINWIGFRGFQQTRASDLEIAFQIIGRLSKRRGGVGVEIQLRYIAARVKPSEIETILTFQIVTKRLARPNRTFDSYLHAPYYLERKWVCQKTRGL